MSLEFLQIEHKPEAKPIDASVIWLHGLGADGHDFESVVPALRLPTSMSVRFIFPHAPHIPITINGGMVMPAWYDIYSMQIERKVDVGQIYQSAAEIRQLIEGELAKNVPASRIILAGFSQGGAIAYETALSYGAPLGGLLALSTYFPTENSVQLSEANRQLPILVQHGTYDPVLPISLAEKALAFLQQKHYAVEFQSYPMAHSLCIEQIDAISIWLQARFQASK